MSKKKRTKEEKINAQNRRIAFLENSVQSVPVYNIQYSQQITPNTIPAPHLPIHSYTYVTRDMRQTFVIMAFLLACNIVLYVLQVTHVLDIPFLGN